MHHDFVASVEPNQIAELPALKRFCTELFSDGMTASVDPNQPAWMCQLIRIYTGLIISPILSLGITNYYGKIVRKQKIVSYRCVPASDRGFHRSHKPYFVMVCQNYGKIVRQQKVVSCFVCYNFIWSQLYIFVIWFPLFCT